jgi:26S proteasome regulatory subunit T5
MSVKKDDVNFKEVAWICDGFNGAQLKAVCIEAGMNALKRDASTIVHEDYIEGIRVVQAKKKSDLIYYA